MPPYLLLRSRTRRGLGPAAALVAVATAVSAGAFVASPGAAAEPTVTKKTVHVTVEVGPPGDRQTCDVVGDLYTPSTATAATPAPAILTTNGFGGSKDDQASTGTAFGKRGYVVLSYSGLGFGGSGCNITLDDRDYDGQAGSQLLDFLAGKTAATDGTRIDYVQHDAVAHDGTAHEFDPRVGMIGGSYGGEIQFAVAGIDPRLDTIIPLITWNDLAYSLAPNDATLTGAGVTYSVPGSSNGSGRISSPASASPSRRCTRPRRRSRRRAAPVSIRVRVPTRCSSTGTAIPARRRSRCPGTPRSRRTSTRSASRRCSRRVRTTRCATSTRRSRRTARWPPAGCRCR